MNYPSENYIYINITVLYGKFKIFLSIKSRDEKRFYKTLLNENNEKNIITKSINKTKTKS
jgi:hypothetical protein